MSRHGQGVARGDVKSARRLWRATYEIEGEIEARRHDGEELVEQAERLVFALRAVRLTSRQSTLEEAVVSELDRLELAAKDDREIPGRVTGLAGLDRLLGGLQRPAAVGDRRSAVDGEVAARFAVRPACGAAGAPAPAVRVARDGDSETAQRHLAAESGVSPDRLHSGQIAVRPGDLRLVVVDHLQLLRPTSRRGTASRRFPRSAAA
jgi:replicative DNA helicase